MLYQKIYDQIVERAKTREISEYSEKHHIIPRCMGGTDDKKNLVKLTYREHFLCHWLLCKIHPQNDKLLHAFSRMVHFSRTHTGRAVLLNSKHFEIVKRYYGPIIGKWNKGKIPWNKGLTGSQYKNFYTKGGLTPPSMLGYKWINNGSIQKKLRPNENLPNGWMYGRLDMIGDKNPMRKTNAI